MNFEDLQKKAIEGGVTVDIGARLAMLAAAKVTSPDELEAFLQAMKSPLMDQFPSDKEKKIASASFDETLVTILKWAKVYHPE